MALTPWLVYTTALWNALIPLRTGNAILWQGSPEYYRLVHEQHLRYLQIWSQVIYGPGWQRHDPTTVQGDHWWKPRALRSIADDPVTYDRLAAEKAGTYRVGDPSADWGDSYVFDYSRLRALGFTPRDAIGATAARALPIFALLAIAALWRRRRTLPPVFAALAYATALAAATHAEARLSEPLQPLLLVLVAGALVQLLGARESRTSKPPREPEASRLVAASHSVTGDDVRRSEDHTPLQRGRRGRASALTPQRGLVRAELRGEARQVVPALDLDSRQREQGIVEAAALTSTGEPVRV